MEQLGSGTFPWKIRQKEKGGNEKNPNPRVQ